MDELTHITIDCETGETTTVPLTPDEIAQRDANAATAQAAEQARLDAIAAAEAQRIQDAKNVENLFPNATPDEIASFLRLAGITQ